MTNPSFRRQFIQLFTGTTLAQVLSLLLMPVISRLYSPSEMGEYAIYVSISSIAGLLTNLRLDLAVMLTDTDEEGSDLVRLGTATSILGGLLTAIGLTALGYGILFTSMTALSVTATGGFQCLMNWHSRLRHYQTLAKRSVGEKLLVLLVGLAMGFWGYSHFGLIAAQTVGMGFSFIYLWTLSGMPKWRQDAGLARWLATARKFSDFPRTTAASSVLIALTVFLPAILFAAHFAKADLGQYNFISRLFEVPINLIAYTFSTVYYQHSSRISPSERLRLYWKSMRWLSLLFGPGFLLVAALGPTLIAVIFGDVWREAGTLAAWLAPLTALRLLYMSQSSLLLVKRRLNLDFMMSALLCISQVGGFFAGVYLIRTVLGCVMIMGLAGSVVYGFGLILIHHVLKIAIPK